MIQLSRVVLSGLVAMIAVVVVAQEATQTAAVETAIGDAVEVTIAPRVIKRTEQRTPCSEHDPLRRPFFGDLHVHTALSFDASAQDTRNTPEDAYRFAQGKPMRIQPYDEAGLGQREIRIDRPLDFAAVTDHAEFLGEISRCTTPGSEGYGHPACRLHRGGSKLSQLAFGGLGLTMKRRWDICGDDEGCVEASASTWRRLQDDAEAAYDRSEDCQFTSFLGYEWTATVGRGRNLHHNVIFRNDKVPPRVKSWIETPSQVQLWEYLEQDCVEAVEGCDGVALPHNSNLSDGLIFETARMENTGYTGQILSARKKRRDAPTGTP